MTDHLTLSEVLAMHADQIQRYGGSQGIRDHGLLEAAVNRPQTGYYSDVIEEAGALWESVSQNHPFFDGNKRTAFAAAYTFSRSMASVSLLTPAVQVYFSATSMTQTFLHSIASSPGFATT